MGQHRERQGSGRARTVTLVLLILLLLAGILLAVHFWDSRRAAYPGDPAASSEPPTSSGTPTPGEDEDDTRVRVRYDGQWYTLRDDLETLLVIGIDQTEETFLEAQDYVNDGRADFLLLLVFDPSTKSCRALQINRDAMTDIPTLGMDGRQIGTVYGQLALSHTVGSGGSDSCEVTRDAVEGFLLDTPIDHFLSLTMDALPILNDAVGGVTLTSLDNFGEDFSAGEEVTLRGEMALRYVRARAGLEDSSNAHRMERQRQYMQALYARIEEKIDTDKDFPTQMLSDLSGYLVSDCDAGQLQSLVSRLQSYTLGGIEPIEGESRKGERFMEFYPDEDALQAQLISLFYRLDSSESGESE